jgi:1-deoxy-D-xylulose-5-phosphate reductoisomerase
VAVAAFLGGRLGFLGIPDLIEAVFERHENRVASALPEVLEADRWARDLADSILVQGARAGA